VARASTWLWLGLAMAIAVQGAPLHGASPPLLIGVPGLFGQAPGGPLRVHSSLNSGIDCYRRADYEGAAALFQQAQTGQDELSSDERQELANLVRLNSAALMARQQGSEQLQQAAGAVEAGRIAEAQNLLKAISTNQFLTPADKQKAQRLMEQFPTGASAGSGTSASVAPGVSPGVLARTRILQARQLMARANYEGARALAKEAEQQKVTYNRGEDTPRKVLEDLDRNTNDAKNLLTASRIKLLENDLDGAEELAHRSQDAASGWRFWPWGDSPSKVLKDIAAARMRTGSVEIRANRLPRETTPVVTGDRSEASRQILKQGRLALQANDLVKAKECAEQAQALTADYHWWEDNPGKLLVDVHRAAERNPQALANAPPSVPMAPNLAGAVAGGDSRTQLKGARDLLNAGKLDEAEKIAQRLQAANDTAWSLFEDSPEKLMADLRKARDHHTHEEADRLMTEARKLFAQGNLEAAKASAYRAEVLHGPYDIWDTSERPAKLIAEVNLAQTKSRPGSPTAGDGLAKKDSLEMPFDGHTAPVMPSMASASNDLDGSAPALAAGRSLGSDSPRGPMDRPLDSSPRPLTPDQVAVQAAIGSMIAPPPPFHMGTSTVSGSSGKQRGVELMAESKRLQKEGRLVESRQLALEAQKSGASFMADEDRPEHALLQLTSLATHRIDFLLQEATDYAATGHMDPARFQKAEQNLEQARKLAIGFSLDTQAIDIKMAWVRRTRDQVVKSSPAGTVSMPVGDNAPIVTDAPATPPSATIPVHSSEDAKAGSDLLAKARIELSRGEPETARRLAVEVYNGPYGLQAEADAVLHSIDAEEYNQRTLTCSRSFEAGLGAYYRKDYSQASTILRGLDVSLLSADKQVKLKELLTCPELQPHDASQSVVVTASSWGPSESGRATASDTSAPPRAGTPEESYVRQVQAMQEVKFQEMRDKGLRAQREATERFRNGDSDEAVDILQEYIESLRDTQLEPDRVALLQRPIESRLQQFRTLKAQQAFEKMQGGGRGETFDQVRTRAARIEEHKREQITDLMKQYDTYYKDGKYKEAEMVAMRAHELDPDNAGAAAAVHVAHIQRNQAEFAGIKNRREEMTLHGLNEAEDEGPAVTTKEPIDFDAERFEIAKNRKVFPPDGKLITIKTEKEREIERRLDLPISFDFKDTPLKQVIEDLRDWTGINIVPDQPALDDENISLDRPVTMHLEGVATKSALNLLLHQAHLIYVIKDEVLQITTEAHARGKMESKTYQVADLIIPVDNYTIPNSQNLQKVIEQQATMRNVALTGGNTPYASPYSLNNGTSVGSAAPGSGSPPSQGSGGTHDGTRAPGQTMEDLLIKMITSTIKPETWSDMGGPGTIEYYPLGLALVITQTPDIQEQVAELLAALRRLQDIQVTVEVRFITIDEAFYERIGLDFNLNVVTPTNPHYEPQIISGQFQPFGFDNRFTPQNYIFGLQPSSGPPAPGVPTPDLNIPIRDSSFSPSVPPFGGFPGAPGVDGGISLGLAFLSDIQVFLFLEAAQGDRRTNVMQAPKLTLFNGQFSTVNIQDQQYFVTNVTAASAAGQVVFIPQNQAFPTGVFLGVQAVVSADRRFVRLNLTPNLTNLTQSAAALFPITTFITPVFENGSQGLPIPFTQYLQQPKFNTVNVQTTVNVPDGGTVLLGGLKTLREGRNEFGPPVLSKIPYINRLFKNVGYGRETESLLLMVTPRVIINEEEETKQTGEGTGPGSPGTPGGPPAR
jgi:type II secretory pathway component GspD/PulD (secretin)/tetratricopeptide (TPR) repeat protein